MKPSEMNPKQLREAREELKKRLRDTLRPSRVISLTDSSVSLEGGRIPARYEHDRLKGKLIVWSKGGKNYAGADLTIDTLAEAERVLMNFFYEMHEGV